MTEPEDDSPADPKISRRASILSRRQVLGVFLILLLVFSGRWVRHRLLIGPQGQWNQELWLDGLLDQAEAAEAPERAPKPRLTTPLPINLCSRDSLTLLPGVGPVLADRIDAVRKEGKVFRTAPELEIVKGIGPALVAKLGPVIDFRVEEPATVLPDSLPIQDSMSANSR